MLDAWLGPIYTWLGVDFIGLVGIIIIIILLIKD